MTWPALPFSEAFAMTQAALGLHHYHAVCTEAGHIENTYADIDADPEGGTATVRFNRARCEQERETVPTAVHEALHLLLADYKHALQSNSRTAPMEEERVVRRLEFIVAKAIFGTVEPEQTIIKSRE